MLRPSNAALPLLVAALIGVTNVGCKKNSVKVKPNEIPPTENTTPAPPPAGTEPTPGKVPPPTSPTTPTPPNSDPAKTSQALRGRVRILYAATDAPAIDIFARGVFARGVRGAVVERLAPGTGTAYTALPATRIGVRATASDSPQTTLLESGDLGFAPGRDSTVVALTRSGALDTLVLTDDNTPAADGRAKIRLVHAATGVPAVRVLLNNGNAAALRLAPGTATDAYVEVTAGDCSLALLPDRPGGAPGVFSLDLRAGAVYTVVIADGPGGSAPRLQVYTDH